MFYRIYDPDREEEMVHKVKVFLRNHWTVEEMIEELRYPKAIIDMLIKKAKGTDSIFN